MIHNRCLLIKDDIKHHGTLDPYDGDDVNVLHEAVDIITKDFLRGGNIGKRYIKVGLRLYCMTWTIRLLTFEMGKETKMVGRFGIFEMIGPIHESV